MKDKQYILVFYQMADGSYFGFNHLWSETTVFHNIISSLPINRIFMNMNKTKKNKRMSTIKHRVTFTCQPKSCFDSLYSINFIFGISEIILHQYIPKQHYIGCRCVITPFILFAERLLKQVKFTYTWTPGQVAYTSSLLDMYTVMYRNHFWQYSH